MYVYIESSSPRKEGEDAALLSGVLPARQDTCLSFFYNMYGEKMGQLIVALEVSVGCPLIEKLLALSRCLREFSFAFNSVPHYHLLAATTKNLTSYQVHTTLQDL